MRFEMHAQQDDPLRIRFARTGGFAGVRLDGDFDAGADEMTPAQEGAIVEVNALLCRKFNLSPSTDTIVYHHWYDLNSGLRTDGSGTTKTCPGTAFFGGNTVAEIPIHQNLPLEKPTAPMAYPGVAPPQGMVAPVATAVAGLAVGAVAGAALVASRKLSKGEPSAEPPASEQGPEDRP